MLDTRKKNTQTWPIYLMNSAYRVRRKQIAYTCSIPQNVSMANHIGFNIILIMVWDPSRRNVAAFAKETKWYQTGQSTVKINGGEARDNKSSLISFKNSYLPYIGTITQLPHYFWYAVWQQNSDIKCLRKATNHVHNVNQREESKMKIFVVNLVENVWQVSSQNVYWEQNMVQKISTKPVRNSEKNNKCDESGDIARPTNEKTDNTNGTTEASTTWVIKSLSTKAKDS